MRYHEMMILLIHMITLATLINSSQIIVSDSGSAATTRSFTIDYDNNTFLMNGKPFRFVGGSFHYFRAHPNSWQRKLRTMRAAGLNAVTTYVEWSLHNPKDGVYNWEGIANLEHFIELAQAEDLHVILRPGPYICAERDMGGFPYWLLNKYPNIQLRTSDIDYKREVQIWYSHLMSKIQPLLYGNRGPIIMVGVENEYGSFRACDRNYTTWLRDLTLQYVEDKAVLFTNDGPSLLRCGHVENVLPTLDFGAGDNIDGYWVALRLFQPKGPLVNMEYYPGWLTHWQEAMQRVGTGPVVNSLKKMLDRGANVNFYMFYGGTNFGFTAGANDGGPGRYNADVTSYDYDAPMDEAGDPTPKYMALREAIQQYLPLPNISVPLSTPKRFYGPVDLQTCCTLLSPEGKRHLSEGQIRSLKPLTFEALSQYSGLVLYETDLPVMKRDPVVLEIPDLRDRAYVYIDRNLIGVLSRENAVKTLPISAGMGQKLQILVESQGRINFNIPNDFKGIIGDVLLENRILKHWNMTKYPLDDYEKIDHLIRAEIHVYGSVPKKPNPRSLIRSGPTVFHGEFTIEEGDVYDTYLDLTGWGKGVAFVNGFNLGRYWPLVGPQITLYVPSEILNVGLNRIVLIEYQKAPESGEIVLVDVPNLDGFSRR